MARFCRKRPSPLAGRRRVQAHRNQRCGPRRATAPLRNGPGECTKVDSWLVSGWSFGLILEKRKRPDYEDEDDNEDDLHLKVGIWVFPGCWMLSLGCFFAGFDYLNTQRPCARFSRGQTAPPKNERLTQR